MKKVGIYSRQSLDKKDSLSIDTQIEKCIALCSYKGKEYQIYTDKGYSGKNTIRPEFTQLMNDVKDDLIDEIMVYRLDRISRNLNDFTNMVNSLDKYNCTFTSATESFDTSSPMGRAMTYLLVVFAQLERENIAERIKDNAMYRATLGRWTGGVVPFGYKKERVAENGASKTLLVHDPEEAALIKQFFDWYSEAKGSVRGIVYKANLMGIKTREGSEWSSSTIGRILQNLIYASSSMEIIDYFRDKNFTLLNEIEEFTGENGMMFYRARQNDEKRRKGLKLLEQYVIIGEHQGIIDGDTWVKTQNKLSSNKITNARPNAGKISWLTGLVKCGYCESNMSIFWSESKVARHNYFKCRRREMNGKFLCESKSIRMDTLEEYVSNKVIELYNNPSFISDLKKEINKIGTKVKVPLKDQNKHLLTNIREKEKELDNIVTNLRKTTSDRLIKLIESQVEDIEKEISILSEEYAKSNIKIDHTENLLMNKEYIVENYREFITSFEAGTTEKKHQLANGIIKSVQVKKDEININFF